jgi:hypothetical protein
VFLSGPRRHRSNGNRSVIWLFEEEVVVNQRTILGSQKWEWSRSSRKTSPGTPIDDADSASYRPADADANMYVQAMVTYTDALGPDKTAMSGSVTVSPADPILAEHDDNLDGMIDRSEAIAAVTSYLRGEGDVSRAEAIAVIQRYLMGN